MSKTIWLEEGNVLFNNVKISKHIAFGDEWQLFTAVDGQLVLVIDNDYYEKVLDAHGIKNVASGLLQTSDARRQLVFFSKDKWLSDHELQRFVSVLNAKGNVNEALLQAAAAENNTRSFSLPGRPELEKFFNENILDIIDQEGKYKRMGIEFPTAFVLHGPSGCGKTFAVEKLVEYLGWPLFSIDSNSIGSPYIHETAKKTSQVFNAAVKKAPAVITIDEMEAFLMNRNHRSAGTEHIEEVAEFLRLIPYAAKNKVLVVAMTNMIEQIDPAILRRGRFDHIIKVDLPSAEEIEALLKSLLAPLPTDDIDLLSVAKPIEGRPISDVAFVVREAGRLAVKSNQSAIDTDLLLQAVQSLNEKQGR